jgi:elongation factor G
VIPQAESLRYATELCSLTHGRGSFAAELSHYEEVPPNAAHQIIEAAQKAGFNAHAEHS